MNIITEFTISPKLDPDGIDSSIYKIGLHPTDATKLIITWDNKEVLFRKDAVEIYISNGDWIPIKKIRTFIKTRKHYVV